MLPPVPRYHIPPSSPRRTRPSLRLATAHPRQDSKHTLPLASGSDRPAPRASTEQGQLRPSRPQSKRREKTGPRAATIPGTDSQARICKRRIPRAATPLRHRGARQAGARASGTCTRSLPPPPAGYNPGTLARPARTWYRRSAMRRVVGAKGASGGDRGEGSRGLSGCVVSCPRGLWRTILARVSAGHVGGAGRSLMRRSGLLATLQPLPDARASPGKNRAHPSLPPRGATPA